MLALTTLSTFEQQVKQAVNSFLFDWSPVHTEEPKNNHEDTTTLRISIPGLQVLKVITIESPEPMTVTIMTNPSFMGNGHYTGPLRKVVHRYKTEYVPFDQSASLTPTIGNYEETPSVNVNYNKMGIYPTLYL